MFAAPYPPPFTTSIQPSPPLRSSQFVARPPPPPPPPSPPPPFPPSNAAASIAATPAATARTADPEVAGQVTAVTATGNTFGNRTYDFCCTLDRRTAGNTRRGDLMDNPRWTCWAETVKAGEESAGEEGQIIYEFVEA